MSENASNTASPRIALVAAIAVGVGVLVIGLAGWITSLVSSGLYGGFAQTLFASASSIAWEIVAAVVQAVVVFLVVWKLVPLDRDARLSRIALAAGVSAVAYAIVQAVFGVLRSLSFGLVPDRSFFSGSFPDLGGLQSSALTLASSILGIPAMALTAFPLIALVLLVVARHRAELRGR